MGYDSFKISAPGKLMILGEHAVLHGSQALVCAVNKRLRLTFTPRDDSQIFLQSDLGDYHSELKEIKIRQPFHFVLTTINQFSDQLTSGFNLYIESEFPDTVGLGSSSAVTVATTAGLCVLLNKPHNPEAIFSESLKIVRYIQGTGSGADVAASVFGGIIAYRYTPLEIHKLDSTCPITVVYSGKKTPTTQVIGQVSSLRNKFPALCDSIYEAMDKSCTLALNAIKNENWTNFGELLNINQGLMDALGVCDVNLAKIVYEMRDDPGIMGSKISGSGLGDCVVGLGAIRSPGFSFPVLPIEIDLDGVRIE